jgi:hypothetical protein
MGRSHLLCCVFFQLPFAYFTFADASSRIKIAACRYSNVFRLLLNPIQVLRFDDQQPCVQRFCCEDFRKTASRLETHLRFMCTQHELMPDICFYYAITLSLICSSCIEKILSLLSGISASVAFKNYSGAALSCVFPLRFSCHQAASNAFAVVSC